jgi:hypothetical protein
MIPSVPLPDAEPIASLIDRLQDADSRIRQGAAEEIFRRGRRLVQSAVAPWLHHTDLRDWLKMDADFPEMVVAIAVDAERFEKIRAATGMPRLADVPPDQDAREFEPKFQGGVRLDVLSTRGSDSPGAISRHLQKFGVGIQHIEIASHDVECVTGILRSRFGLHSIYPETRAGADGTRINFFLVPVEQGRKVLIEIVQEAAVS